jgi:AraC family transcriptional activator of tynA and feaB
MDVEQSALELVPRRIHLDDDSDNVDHCSPVAVDSKRGRPGEHMDKILAMSDTHPRDRLAYWYDVACKVFVKHECRVEKNPAFDASIHRGALGELSVIEVESRGLNHASVTARNIANDEDGVFLLGLQLEGSVTLIQDGREATLQPGDFALLDAQRAYTSHYSRHWRRLFIKIPHRALKARLAPTSQLTARAVRHGSGVGGILSDYVRLLPPRIGSLQGIERERIGEQLLDLIALALSAQRGSDEAPSLSSARAVALLQLRTVIEARLHDPSLDPEAAAAAAGISVRYANSLLANEGQSLQRLIVSRRLERCRTALADARQAHRSVSEIAYAWGFSDQSHFTRRFRAAYGCSPSDFRKQNSV